MTFESAGDDADLLEQHRVARIESRRRTADQSLSDARAALSAGDAAGAELAGRRALHEYAGCLNVAEDSSEEVDAHQAMDRAGRWVRMQFGCRLRREGSSYFDECPVSLGHVRVGLSIGGTARKICALCGVDVSECPHLRGTAYLVPGGSGDLGWCRVCLSKGACPHSPSQLYRVSVVAIVTELHLEEASIVSKPAMPDARFTSQSVSTSELHEALGDTFVPGVEVSCDKCLRRCEGLRRPNMADVRPPDDFAPLDE